MHIQQLTQSRCLIYIFKCHGPVLHQLRRPEACDSPGPWSASLGKASRRTGEFATTLFTGEGAEVPRGPGPIKGTQHVGVSRPGRRAQVFMSPVQGAFRPSTLGRWTPWVWTACGDCRKSHRGQTDRSPTVSDSNSHKSALVSDGQADNFSTP